MDPKIKVKKDERGEEAKNVKSVLTREGNFVGLHCKSLHDDSSVKRKSTAISIYTDCIKYHLKHKKKEVVSIPLDLIWLVPDPKMDSKKFDDAKEAKKSFELCVPEGRMVLVAKSEEEKTEFVNEIQKLLKDHFGKLPDEARSVTKYAFMHGFGHYEGEWKNGKIHGRGKFVSIDGTVFEGDWNGELMAGFGTIVLPVDENAASSGIARMERVYQSGWKSNLPFGTVKEFGEKYPLPNEEDTTFPPDASLTESDIRLLLTGAVVKTYKKGDIILAQGDANKRLYRIKSGTIILQKEVGGKQTVIARMGAEATFGEMSVLDKQIISATVIADSDKVELYVMEVNGVYDLFKSSPGLSRRYHKLMSFMLAQRLGGLHSGPSPKWVEKKDNEEEPLDGIARRTTHSFSDLLVTNFEADEPQSQEEESPQMTLTKRWLAAWNNKNIKDIGVFFAKDVIYRDPFIPQGCQSKVNLLKHIAKMFNKYPTWKWEILELSNVQETGFALRCKVVITSTNSATLKEHSLSLIVVNEFLEILRCEIYFDTSAMVEKSLSVSLDKEKDHDPAEMSEIPSLPLTMIDSPIKQRKIDIKYAEKFGLPKSEILIKEYACSLTVGISPKKNTGTMYISSRFVCFFSKIFGLKTKEVIPIKSMKSIKRKGKGITLKMFRKDQKEDIDLDSSKHIEYNFSFSDASEEEVEEVHVLIKHIFAGMDHEIDDLASPRNVLNASSKLTIKESYVQKYVRCSTLAQKLPVWRVKPLPNESSVRLHGLVVNPDNTVLDSFGGPGRDVAASSVSTYPLEAFPKPNGEIELNPLVRLGDPNCDQFCIERYESRTIAALADGCNWGEKVRRAALQASRTFVEYVKKHQNQAVNLQEAGKLFLLAFAKAHHKIIESVQEEKWWELGQTTLLGGSLVQVLDGPSNWVFVCCSVGDCKAFHISVKNRKFTDISTGSRSGNAATDARDSGGRLGPDDNGNPILNNMNLYYQPVQEGDIILLVSDGVYDNFDPQHMGLTPRDVDALFEYDDWHLAPPHVAESLKTQFITQRLEKMFDTFANEELKHHDVLALDIEKFVTLLTKHCYDFTKASREFMETNPGKKQPADYKLFPGKMDHTTVVAIKVKPSDISAVEQELDGWIMKMRHPLSGITAQKRGRTGRGSNAESPPGTLTSLNVSMGSSPSTSSPSNSLVNTNILPAATSSEDSVIPFTVAGSEVIQWLSNNGQSRLQCEKLAQLLLNFAYICPITELDNHNSETFSVDALYRFQVFEPILNRRDWDLILQGSRVITYNKGDKIIQEGKNQHQRIFHIISGTCRIEKRNKKSGEKSKSKLVLGTIRDTETFGEIGFLEGGPASASVIADSDSVSVYIIDGNFINILFVVFPSLAGRFYHYLASVLARRLRKQEAAYFQKFDQQ